MLFLIQFFICGILTALLFPPFFLMPLGFVIYPYLFKILSSHENLKKNNIMTFLSGFIYGLGFIGLYLLWIKEPFLIDANNQKFSILSYLLIIYCSLYFGFSFLILKLFKYPLLRLIMLPIILVLSEHLCSLLGYGFPWITYSLIHSSNNFGLIIVYYLGTFGLSYLTLIIFFLPSLYLINKDKKIFLNIYYLIFNIMIIILIIFLTTFNKILKEKNNSFNKSITIGISQVNFKINNNMDKKQKQKRLNIIINEINNFSGEILVFGENNYPYLLNEINSLDDISEKINDNISVLIGATRKQDDGYYNSMFLLEKNKYLYFDKQILVPFGEFLPLRKYFSFLDIIVGSVDFTKGTKVRKIITKNNISLIPIICYEIIFPRKLINNNNINSDILINITNDSWFGNFSGPYQHFYLTRLRASEINKNLVRVSNNGVSAIFDNNGKILNYIPLNKKDMKTVKFDINQKYFNYLKYHNYIIYFLYLIFFSGILLNRLNVSK